MPPALLSFALKYTSAPTDMRPLSPPSIASSSSIRLSRARSLSSALSAGAPSLPKLCSTRTPSMLSSALYVYSVHQRPVSCWRLSMTLLGDAPLRLKRDCVRSARGSEMAATSAWSVGESRVE